MVFSPILPRSYGYTVIQYDFSTGTLKKVGTPLALTVTAIEVEFQTINHWWIYLASNYHDSFYYTYFDAKKAIPTQVTGAVGESLAVVVMQRIYGARNVRSITPHPSSKTADFEMDIDLNGRMVHALVESKGSNVSSMEPNLQIVYYGAVQLVSTQHAHPSGTGYLIITSYPMHRCFVIKVF